MLKLVINAFSVKKYNTKTIMCGILTMVMVVTSFPSVCIISEPYVVHAAQDVTETQLFGEYNEYLYNSTYFYETPEKNKKAILRQLRTQTDDLTYQMTDSKSLFFSSLKTSMEKQDLKRVVYELMGLDITEEDMEKEVALKYMQDAMGSKEIEKAYKQFSTAKEAGGFLKSWYKTLNLDSYSSAYERNKAIEKAAQELADGLEQETGNKWDSEWLGELIKASDNNWSQISSVFKKSGHVITLAEVIVSLVEALIVQRDLIEKTQSLIDKNSALYRGLSLIRSDQEVPAAAFITSLLQKGVFEKISGIIGDGVDTVVGGGYLTLAKAIYKTAGYAMFSVPELDDLTKLSISIDDQVVLDLATSKMRSAIKTNWDNKGTDEISSYEADYKFLMNMYFISIKDSAEKSIKIAKTREKAKIKTNKVKKIKKLRTKLQKTLKKYKGKLNSDSYIKSCLENAKNASKDNSAKEITNDEIDYTIKDNYVHLYKEYIKEVVKTHPDKTGKMGPNDAKAAFIYLNEDDIPELVITGLYGYGTNNKILTIGAGINDVYTPEGYKQGDVFIYNMYGYGYTPEFVYKPKENTWYKEIKEYDMIYYDLLGARRQYSNSDRYDNDGVKYELRKYNKVEGLYRLKMHYYYYDNSVCGQFPEDEREISEEEFETKYSALMNELQTEYVKPEFKSLTELGLWED